MWLSELVGRLSQQLKEEGDMQVVSKVKGFHTSKHEDNYFDVDSRYFNIVEFGGKKRMDIRL